MQCLGASCPESTHALVGTEGNSFVGCVRLVVLSLVSTHKLLVRQMRVFCVGSPERVFGNSPGPPSLPPAPRASPALRVYLADSGPARNPLGPSRMLQLLGSSVLTSDSIKTQSQLAFTQSAGGTSKLPILSSPLFFNVFLPTNSLPVSTCHFLPGATRRARRAPRCRAM